MKFASWSFWIAGVYGIVVLLPQLFLENRIGQKTLRRLLILNSSMDFWESGLPGKSRFY